MINKQIFQVLINLGLCVALVRCTYSVKIKQDGPIVRGATITFKAVVYYGDEIDTNDNLRYQWKDNAIPQHTRSFASTSAIDIWPVSYNVSYPQGEYEVQVTVTRCITLDIYCYIIASERQYFYITDTLNGVLELHQNNITRNGNFVSSIGTVTHSINIKKTDEEFIASAPTVLTYWFIDCVYYGFTKEPKFDFNYTVAEKTHVVEALIVADFTPIPPTTTVPPSTTTKPTITTKSTTTTTTKPTTTKSITTTTKPTTTKSTTTNTPTLTHTSPTFKSISTSTKPNVIGVATISNKNLIKREISSTETPGKNKSISHLMVKVNGTLVPLNQTFPYVCNNTEVVIDPSKIYGFFSDTIDVKAPLSKPNVSGNNWLQPGELLSLKVSCTGSKDIGYCVQYKKGEYNITGNETCFFYIPLDACDFSITRYFSYSKNTIVIIIKNDVSKYVTPVTVNIYKVNKQAQLSVIVVPVAFSLVAVVLIVFGVAYYIQNRSRFIVEVADFNFSQQYSEAEYKTFKERLRDSIMNAFTRGPTPSNSEVPVWPPGQKYGSMT